MQFTDLVAGQTANPATFDQQGMVVPGTGGVPAAQGGAPLPNLGPKPPGTPQTTTTGNPVDVFNANLMTLLSRGQAAGNTAPLANEQNRLGVQQINNSQAPASSMGIDNLKPGDALNARQNAGQLYNPEIKNLTARISASANAVANFSDAIKAAKDFGESYTKSVQATPEDIQAVQDMLIAGYNPGQDVLNNRKMAIL